MGDLKERHRLGTHQLDDIDKAPTGPEYQRIYQQQAAEKQLGRQLQLEQQQKQEERLESVRKQVQQQLSVESDNSDDDDGDDYDDDPALAAIRQRRLQELQQAQIQKSQDLARGHGQYRTISQDEFLSECTGSSEFVAVHFFHQEFQRCDLMDHHLKMITPIHTTCKFLRLDAEKAPFFVTKLQIRTLPTLIVFQHGKAIARLTGFEGLSDDPVTKPDQWKTSRLQEWLAETGAIEYTANRSEREAHRAGIRGTIYRGGIERYEED